MSNYDFLKPRERHRSLFIVEGYHEKYKLIDLLLKSFREIKIRRENIVIFQTNIYILYEKIQEEYGEDWDEQDVNLLMVIRNREEYPVIYERKNFIDIFLIFDYEHHDPLFSEEKICRMQKYFNDSVEVGKLYINYPMVESYMHFPGWPDDTFENTHISDMLKRGKNYKNSLNKYLTAKLVALPDKIDGILEKKYGVEELEKRSGCVEQLLLLQDMEEIEEKVGVILSNILSGKNLQTAKYQLLDILEKMNYCKEGFSYYGYMRKLFKSIIRHNIYKAYSIQGGDYKIPDKDLEDTYFELDFLEILKTENELSRDAVSGIIKVLNTSVFLVSDYRFSLIEADEVEKL